MDKNKTKKETRCFDLSKAELRIKTGDDGKRFLRGYAAVFNSPSEDLGGFTESIAPGAFIDALKSSDVRALVNHDSNLILGRTANGTLELKEDERGLFMEVELPGTSYSDDLIISVERGDITQQSFSFYVDKDSYEEKDDGTIHRTIERVREIFDVSPVTYPAYPDTTVDLRSLEKFKQDRANTAKGNANITENENIDFDLLTLTSGDLQK